jgi:hypothetical protein
LKRRRSPWSARWAGAVWMAVAFLVLLSACSRPAAGPPGASGTAGPTPLVDPAEIISGGPPPDGIPPIDDPKFLEASEAEFLSPAEPVISLVLGGHARAYPAQILVWHEIVNDTVGRVPVTVTYCPLCNTGIAFRRPVIDGKLLDFGTSGKLYHSNLVMYDRQTESLWPQALGQAVMGPLTGTKLELVPVQMVAWEDWLAEHPRGKVLSRDTGTDRPYGQNPYEGYDSPNSAPFLFQGTPDPRLPPKARVVGVQVGTDVMAFPYDRLQAVASGGWAAVSATVGGRPVVVFWKEGAVSAVDRATISQSRGVGSTGAFDRRQEGRTLSFRGTAAGALDDQTGSAWDIFGRAVSGPLEGRSLNMVISIESFWFDWAAFHPDTRIYGR